MPNKLVMSLILLAGIPLSGCTAATSRTSSPDTSVVALTVPTTVAVTSTTEAQLSTVDEPVVECDVKALRAAFKSKMVLDTCTTTWAVGNTDRDTWNCSKDGCSQVDLYHLDGGTWRSTATCHVDQPLTYWKGSCYRADMAQVTDRSSQGDDRRRAQLLEAAAKVFVHAPSGGLTLAAVAAEAKVSKRLMYYYFADIQSLYNELFRVRVDDHVQNVDTEITATRAETSHDRITTAVRVFLQLPAAYRRWALLAVCDSLPPELQSQSKPVLDLLINAGEILVGQHTPFSAANFIIGCPASLPTSGFAHVSSGITVETFLKRTAVAKADLRAARRMAPSVIALAEHEGFPAHAAALRLRQEG